MRPITLALLGCFQAGQAGAAVLHLPKKTQALLGYLGLRPGQVYAREHLAALLWGETGDEQARQGLRQAMYVLQKTLPTVQPLLLVMEGETVALNPAAVDVDVAVFEHLLVDGRSEALEQAAALYRGDLLEGLNIDEPEFEEWLVAERERLRELALQALAKLLDQQAKAGQTERAIQTGVKLLALDPLQEDVHRTLMRLYARQGRRSAALKQYQHCVASLQRELGAEPERDTRQLYQDLLQQRRLEPASVDTIPSAARLCAEGPAPLELTPEPLKRDARLIGRDAELGQLSGALDEALRAHGRVVAIAGEAGIGKSSLLTALAVEAHARGARSLLGRCYQTEQVLAFGPWVEALRGGRVVADLDVLDRLPRPWRAELVRLLPELGRVGEEPAGTSTDNLRLFEAVTELVRNLAARQPLLVMLEDLHWADEMSSRLVAFLARRIRTSRVLVVLTFRDDELASVPVLRDVVDELSCEAHFIHLALSTLARADAVALARSLAGTPFPPLGWLDEQIWRASEGNPFMVVETVRALQEGIPPSTATALPLPERVRRIVAGRLERLSDRGRHLVSVAATIGREFDFALLQRAAGLSEPEAAAGVEELVWRRVLHGVGERFGFTHERLRQVAYDLLLPPRRKMLHIQVAKALEDLCADSQEGHHATLAGHYRAGEVWDKALLHSRLGWAQAVRLSAYPEAVACFEQALEALKRLPASQQTLEAAVDPRFDLRNALLPLAEHDSMRGFLRKPDNLTNALDDQRRLGWLSVYVSRYCRTTGHFTEATEFASTARSLGDRLGDVLLGLNAGLDLGAAYLALGEFRRAAALFRHILRSFNEDLSRPPPESTATHALFARMYLVRSLTELGEFDEGLACGEDGLRIARTLDDPMSLTYAYVRLGRLHAARGELNRAALELERGRELARARSISFTEPIVTADLGHVYALLGRVADGLSLLRDALNNYASTKFEVGKARLLIHLADACLRAGQLEDAQAHAEAALAHTHARGQRGYEAYARRLLAEIASGHPRADLDAAEAHYRESITLAAALGMRPLLAQGHWGLGTLHRKRGQVDLAREHLTETVGLFRQMEMRAWLGEAEAELNTVTASPVGL